MPKEKSVFRSFDELPLCISADEIAGALNISRTKAFNLMHREDFPSIRIGRRIIVPRDRFLIWMQKELGEL